MSGYIGVQPVPQTTQTRESFTATADQTSFGTSGYQVDHLDVYLNGVKLAAADYTATNGSDIVLESGAAVNDILEIVAFSTFTVANQAFTGTTTVDNLSVTGTLTSAAINMGSSNLTTTGKMLYANVYSSTGDLPSASTYHGMFAHVHGTGLAYYAHAGAWIPLAKSSELPTDATIRAAVEAATNSNVFTDADHTKLNALEASADVTDTANVTSAGALMDSEVTNLAQVKAFDSTDYATAAQGTTANAALPKTGGAMTGAITTNSTFDGVDIATRDAVLTTTTNTANAALPKAGGTITSNLDFLQGNHIRFKHASGGTIRASISAESNDNLQLNTGSSETARMTINTSGNVGIGIAAPAQKLHVNNSSGTTLVRAEVGAGSAVGFNIKKTGGTTQEWSIVDGATVNGRLQILDVTDNRVDMTFDGTGKVGIGTTSPLRQLHISNTSANSEIAFTAGTSGASSLLFGDGLTGTDVYKGYLQYQHNGDYMVFAAAATERMRINSTGVAVTGTASSTGTFSPSNSNWTTAAFKAAGAYGGALALVDGSAGYATYVQSSGGTYVIAQGATSGALTTRVQINGSGHLIVGSASHGDDNLYLVRSGTGKMLRLYSGSSEVGAMGSLNTNNLTISGTAADHGGLQFGTHCVLPMEANADSNGTITLGGSGSRFKDLYLSGGVDFGGAVNSGGVVSSSNKLDDYEEGTFTLAMVGYYGNPNTAVNITANYTKVGNRVYISCEKTSINNTGASGNMWFTGLPFTTVGSHIGSCNLNGIGTYPNSSPYAAISGLIVYIQKHVNQGADTAVFHNVVTNGGIVITGTYLVS